MNGKSLLLLGGVIVLALASLLCFVTNDVELLTILGVAFAGIAACFASELVP